MKTSDYKHIYETILEEVSKTYTRESIIKKTADRDFAKLLTGTPEEKQDVIDTYDLQSCRVCEICGELMVEGYLLDSSTLCSDECAAKWYNLVFKNANMTPEQFHRMMEEDDDGEGDWYWSEWY